jgi:hypothetical protein
MNIRSGIFETSGILQADAYDGYNELEPSRSPGPITSALCWAHARRQFFELADIAANAPMRDAARTQARSRRLHWRHSGASTCCSISSAASTALPPMSGCVSGND